MKRKDDWSNLAKIWKMISPDRASNADIILVQVQISNGCMNIMLV